MNILNKTHKESGVGLIEILIVLVVLVIGWAAIAALQGSLMSGSSATKARNIALELAREKTEELRSEIEKGQYDDVFATGSIEDGQDIINATFTRSWTLVDAELLLGQGGVDHLNKLVMTVTWKGNDYDPVKDNLERVVLNSMIAFSDPLRSTSLVTGGADSTGKLAPPNSETGREGPGTVVGSPVEDDPGRDSNDDDSIWTGEDEAGNLVVYQGLASDAGRFTGGLTVYGGKLLKLAGMIYHVGNDPYVQATAPSFCRSFPVPDCGLSTALEFDNQGLTVQCVRYVCYVGGDCSNTAADGGECGNNQDYIDSLPDLNGGWYGKIGDFFPTIKPADYPTVCMSDPLNQTDTGTNNANTSFVSIGIPARLFVTKRVYLGSSTGFSREGINKSFEGYDTLISDASDQLCTTLRQKLTTRGIEVDPRPLDVNGDPILDGNGDPVPRQIADYETIRCLAEDAANLNVVLPSTPFDPSVAPNIVPNDICQPLP
jgi:hypothetical protein